jgi:preprotein translocase subunit SecG
MEKIIITHGIIALEIIGLILIQQGKGAEMGASFGSGASQTMFGSGGSINFFTKLTALLAVAFFSTSFSLAIIAKNQSSIPLDDGVPIVVEEAVIDQAIERPMIEDDVPFIEQVVEQARTNNTSDSPAVDTDIPVSVDK